MILKKFFGKTIETAKKSARQLYGEDIVILESFHPDGNNDAGVTVLVDTPSASRKTADVKESKQNRFRNVFYKRSDIAAPSNRSGVKETGRSESVFSESSFSKAGASANGSAESGYTDDRESPANTAKFGSGQTAAGRTADVTCQPEQMSPGKPESNGDSPGHNRFNGNQQPRKISNNLKALRKFALDNEVSGVNEQRFREPGNNGGVESHTENRRSNSVKKTRFQPGAGHHHIKGFTSPEPDQQQAGVSAANRNGNSTRRSRFQTDNTTEVPAYESSAAEYNSRREVTALHKRFDKLEALLDSALISSNLDYASHPAFQQLVQTGIKATVIARWFRDIIERGIDPDEEPRQFMTELSTIIRNALKSDTTKPAGKYMLFTGPSGSGKTHLLMKLLLHPEFMMEKRVAAVLLHPENNNKQPYYSILQPFCEDHNIPCYTVSSHADVHKYQTEWEQYDHVLFDSPAIPVEQEGSFRQYWKVRQMLASLTPLEVHYVVNASLNRYYFRYSGKTHHPLQPDFVAITHLDEVSEWGPVIPFLEEMGCGARYISMSPAVPDGLSEFNPAWFAQQVLQDT